MSRLALAFLALAACVAEEGELPPEIDAVVEDGCRRCHAAPPDHFAPMPLVTWRDFHRRGSQDRPYFEILEARVTAPDFPMPPKESPEQAAFNDAERQLLLDWIADGAPPAPWP